MNHKFALFQDLVLARWGHGNFLITGWGWMAGMFHFGIFGTFVREVAKERSGR